MDKHPDIDRTYYIFAGKLRRYHNEALWRQLLAIPTQLRNARDLLYLLIGTVQAWRILGALHPAAIFVKGGFVTVPVAWAAARRHIPYGTHDSDTVPGLANRLIAKRASWHATGMPEQFYNYPSVSMVHTGIPISQHFQRLSNEQIRKAKQALGLKAELPVIMVIGGGLGARELNRLSAQALAQLLSVRPEVQIIHLTGKDHLKDVQHAYEQLVLAQHNITLVDFTPDVYRYSAAADVIITRAGATAMAEFAAQAKACIIVPSPYLSGGHQSKNAAYFASQQAAEVFNEDQPPETLRDLLTVLLQDKNRRTKLSEQLYSLAKPQAAQQIASLLLQTTGKRNGT